jgi:hypothetical protein
MDTEKSQDASDLHDDDESNLKEQIQILVECSNVWPVEVYREEEYICRPHTTIDDIVK